MSKLVEQLLESYQSDARGQAVGRRFLPSRQGCLEALELCLELLFPGYGKRRALTTDNLQAFVAETVDALRHKLADEIEQCLCYGQECAGQPQDPCALRAAQITGQFLDSLPALRRTLLNDAQAALDGDPAATNLDEVILAYPGYLAITVHRIAHQLWRLEVPMMPRILSEWAHAQTGADLHPAAHIGERFFLDHATGAVVGATSQLGQGVRMYQGVTLGALSLPRGDDGKVRGASKRHPTVGDDVTLYANVVILGGNTTIGDGTVVGGSVFLTQSVPAGSRVILDPPKLRVQSPQSRTNGNIMVGEIDFEI